MYRARDTVCELKLIELGLLDPAELEGPFEIIDNEELLARMQEEARYIIGERITIGGPAPTSIEIDLLDLIGDREVVI